MHFVEWIGRGTWIMKASYQTKFARSKVNRIINTKKKGKERKSQNKKTTMHFKWFDPKGFHSWLKQMFKNTFLFSYLCVTRGWTQLNYRNRSDDKTEVFTFSFVRPFRFAFITAAVVADNERKIQEKSELCIHSFHLFSFINLTHSYRWNIVFFFLKIKMQNCNKKHTKWNILLFSQNESKKINYVHMNSKNKRYS